MLDLRLIREQPDAVRRGLADRGGAELVVGLRCEGEPARRPRVAHHDVLGLGPARGHGGVGEVRELQQHLVALTPDLPELALEPLDAFAEFSC